MKILFKEKHLKAFTTIAQMAKTAKGISAVAKVGFGAGTVGLGMGLAVAGYEYKTGHSIHIQS